MRRSMIARRKTRRYLRVPAGGEGFDASSFGLSGWWRAGDYALGTWTGTASNGVSGGRDLTEATNPPSVGAALNSLDPADFDGTNDQISSGLTLDDFVNADEWSSWVLFNADAAAADPGAPSRYLAPQFWAETSGAALGMGFSASGIHVFQYQTSTVHKELVIACGTGGWHLAQAKYDGVDLKLRLDSGAWSSTACLNIHAAFLAGTPVRVGANYNATAFFNGKIADLAFADTALSDASFTSLVTYINDTYGLSL